MAEKTSSSKIMAKLGGKFQKAFNKHKNDETELPNMGDLPAGIEGGVAQIVDVKIDEQKKGANAGQPYFYAAGVVLYPEYHNGIKVAGRRTSIIEPLHDTPGRTRETMDDHVSWVLNQLRMLGVATSELDGADIEDVLANLREEAPTFQFRTWKGQVQTEGPYAGREPRVNHTWGGKVEYKIDAGPGSGVTEVSANGDGEEPFNEFEEGGKDVLASLVARADSDDEEAQDELMEKAMEAGMSRAEVRKASYEEMAEYIREHGETQDAEEEAKDEEQEEDEEEDTEESEDEEDASEDKEEETEEVPEPRKGEVYRYKPVDRATGKPARKPVDVEVTAVNKAKKTVDLKNLDNDKTYPKVAWDQLIRDED